MNEFEQADLGEARFRDVDLRGARFERVDLTGAVLREVELVDVTISGMIHNVTINGVDVVPLINAELDRRHPDRVKMRPTDPDGFREAWDLVERFWDDTVARARRLPPEALHENVGGEWSFVQTLRHLVFATDAWVNRVILGDPDPWDPLDLPFDGPGDLPGIPRNRDARPSLDEVLALRKDRMATMRRVVNELADEQLTADTTPVPGAGWPYPQAYPVAECLLTILNEEWQHHQYAVRDLAVLEQR